MSNLVLVLKDDPLGSGGLAIVVARVGLVGRAPLWTPGCSPHIYLALVFSR